MKIIDVLNKIANGEEVRFEIDGDPYHCYKYNNLYDEVEKEEVKWYISEDCLNEEVEIVEENKKIEKLGLTYLKDDGRNEIINKINEIIDVINKGDK